MLTVNVSSNYKKLSRSLDQVGRKQLPFAFAKTLNQTMKAVEKYTVARTYPRAFDVRNRAFFKAAMFTGSTVRRATKTKLRVSARDLLIVATFSYMQLEEPSGQGRDASLSHHASPRRHGEPGVFERRCGHAPWSTHRRASSTGMAHAM